MARPKRKTKSCARSGLMGGMNTFQYAPNPTGWIDPFGLAKKKDCCKDEEDKDPCESDSVTWSRHGGKHVPPPNIKWKDIVKGTSNGRPAKYKPDVDIESFERNAWKKGITVPTPTNKNVSYKIYASTTVIGASDGKETNLIRVECSQGVIHGHPITQSSYNKLLKR